MLDKNSAHYILTAYALIAIAYVHIHTVWVELNKRSTSIEDVITIIVTITIPTVLCDTVAELLLGSQ